MLHEAPLITTIAAAFVLAFVLGFLAWKIRVPPLVGYLLAGTCVVPLTASRQNLVFAALGADVPVAGVRILGWYEGRI